MKFTVEVEEFYLEEGELAAELKHQIKNDVIKQIRDNVKKQVDDFMNDYVIKELDSELKTRVKIQIDEFVATGKVKGKYSGDSTRSFAEWIADNIREDKSALDNAIKKIAASHVEELIKRYDLLFATQLITKIKDQGFLKEDAVKLLLTDEQSNS